MKSFRRNYQVINEHEMLKCLSDHRLDSFRNVYSDASTQKVLSLYFMTQIHASFLFTPLQYLEVALRNRIFYSVRDFYAKPQNVPPGCDPNRWLFWLPQAETTKKLIREAERNALREVKNREVHEGDIISRLTLGTWVMLLYEQSDPNSKLHFWRFTAKDIFPNAPKRKQSFILHRLKEIKSLRNRLFHFEPIWDTRKCKDVKDVFNALEMKYNFILDTIQWLSNDIIYMLKEIGYTATVETTFNKARKNLKRLFAP
jgi:hypothetical protein